MAAKARALKSITLLLLLLQKIKVFVIVMAILKDSI